MGNHSVFAPSAAHRWLVCTASIKACEPFPDVTSEYAAEGALCHELISWILRYRFWQVGKETFLYYVNRIKKNPIYKKDMQEHALLFADYVQKLYKQKKGGRFFIEETVYFSHYAPGGFGSVDFGFITEDMTEIYTIDYKHGKGVEVMARKNPQTMLYSLGMLLRVDPFAVLDVTVTSIIFQSRISKTPKVYTYTVNDLYAFADTVQKTTEDIRNGNVSFVTGNHCMFCRAKPVCKAYKGRKSSYDGSAL